MIKKHYFGHDHEIQYDTIINHDAYKYLRVSLEVPRGQDTEAIVLLNGKEIGKIIVTRDGKKTHGYDAFRFVQCGTMQESVQVGDRYPELGLAISALIVRQSA